MPPNKTTVIRYNKRHICKEEAYFESIWSNPDTLVYSQDKITDIVTNFNEYVTTTVADYRDGVILPLYMGVLIAGIFGKNEHLRDHGATKKMGKRMFHYNHHSDGYGGRIFFVTTPTEKKWAMGKFWGFEATGNFRAKMTEGYRADWKKYRNIESTKDACKLFRKNKAKEYGMKMGAISMESYDEFDFDTD